MNINQVIQNEKTSLEFVHPGTPLAEIELLVQAWDSCALKAVTDFSPNSSLYLAAVRASHLSASHAFKAAHINNWIYVLVQCTHHLDLAEQLMSHPHPLVRTACTKHYSLAKFLKNDVNDYVRNACCQWMEILNSIIDDPSALVRSRQISSSKKMALYYLKNGMLEDRVIAINHWAECRSVVLSSIEDPLYSYTCKLLAKMEKKQ